MDDYKFISKQSWSCRYTPGQIYVELSRPRHDLPDLSRYHYELASHRRDAISLSKKEDIKTLTDDAFEHGPLQHILLHIEMDTRPRARGLITIVERPLILTHLTQNFILPPWLMEWAAEIRRFDAIRILIDAGVKPTERAMILAIRGSPRIRISNPGEFPIDVFNQLINAGGPITEHVFRSTSVNANCMLKYLNVLLDRSPDPPPDDLFDCIKRTHYPVIIPSLIRAFKRNPFRLTTTTLRSLIEYHYDVTTSKIDDLKDLIIGLLRAGTPPSIILVHLAAIHGDVDLVKFMLSWHPKNNPTSMAPFLVNGYIPQDLILRIVGRQDDAILQFLNGLPISPLSYHKTTIFSRFKESTEREGTMIEHPCGLLSETGFYLRELEDNDGRFMLETDRLTELHVMSLVAVRSWPLVRELIRHPNMNNEWIYYIAVIRFPECFSEIINIFSDKGILPNQWIVEAATSIQDIIMCIKHGCCPTTSRIVLAMQNSNVTTKRKLLKVLLDQSSFVFTESLLEMSVRFATPGIVKRILCRGVRPTERSLEASIRLGRFDIMDILLTYGAVKTQRTLEACLTCTLNLHFINSYQDLSPETAARLEKILKMHIDEGLTLSYKILETVPIRFIEGSVVAGSHLNTLLNRFIEMSEITFVSRH